MIWPFCHWISILSIFQIRSFFLKNECTFSTERVSWVFHLTFVGSHTIPKCGIIKQESKDQQFRLWVLLISLDALTHLCSTTDWLHCSASGGWPDSCRGVGSILWCVWLPSRQPEIIHTVVLRQQMEVCKASWGRHLEMANHFCFMLLVRASHRLLEEVIKKTDCPLICQQDTGNQSLLTLPLFLSM